MGGIKLHEERQRFHRLWLREMCSSGSDSGNGTSAIQAPLRSVRPNRHSRPGTPSVLPGCTGRLVPDNVPQERSGSKIGLNDSLVQSLHKQRPGTNSSFSLIADMTSRPASVGGSSFVQSWRPQTAEGARGISLGDDLLAAVYGFPRHSSTWTSSRPSTSAEESAVGGTLAASGGGELTMRPSSASGASVPRMTALTPTSTIRASPTFALQELQQRLQAERLASTSTSATGPIPAVTHEQQRLSSLEASLRQCARTLGERRVQQQAELTAMRAAHQRWMDMRAAELQRAQQEAAINCSGPESDAFRQDLAMQEAEHWASEATLKRELQAVLHGQALEKDRLHALIAAARACPVDKACLAGSSSMTAG